MAYQTIFKRYELKYMLTRKQKEALLEVMKEHMALDQYGKTVIRNIYFDTDNYRLIRHSIEKPAYKEKLRIRSYARAEKNSPVFVELKKKYQSVVYKRRVAMPETRAVDWLGGQDGPPEHSQIVKEIEYFCDFYEKLRPAVFLSYEREAYYSLSGEDFRVTFDENVLSRRKDISLRAEVWGTPLLNGEQALMEVKTAGGIPLWMTHFLAENRLYKTSFSKYGTAYQNQLKNKNHGGLQYA